MVRQTVSSVSNNLLKLSNDADVILTQNLDLKEDRWSGDELWSELRLLNEIWEKINDSDGNDPRTEVEYDCDLDVEKLRKTLLALLSGDIQDDVVDDNDEYSRIKGDNLITIIKATLKRPCFEITHSLWNIMKNYTLGQLKIGLTILFQSVAKLRTVSG